MNMLQVNLGILSVNHMIWLSSHPPILDEEALVLDVSV
jgi:hypothetical protein